jgi:hypothetical protein
VKCNPLILCLVGSRIIEDIHEMETDLFKSSHDDEIPMEIGLNDEQAIIAELHSCRVNLQPGLPTSNDSVSHVTCCHVTNSFVSNFVASRLKPLASIIL